MAEWIPAKPSSKPLCGKLKKKPGLEAEIVCVIGEYVEKGIKDDIDYEYYPTCFVVKPVGGELKKQDSEIQDMQALQPKRLANAIGV